jgi:putative membrane protein
MMAYPCLLLGRRLARTIAGGRHERHRFFGLVAVVTAGVTLATWDLFLDPQMVAAGHWSWRHPVPALPGIPGVPLTNYAGWILVALVLAAALHLTFPEVKGAPEDVPGAMLAWTWAGSTLGNAVFFGRPLVALWGGVLMGLLVVPYLLSWRGERS